MMITKWNGNIQQKGNFAFLFFEKGVMKIEQ